jgi:hypothetical protein
MTPCRVENTFTSSNRGKLLHSYLLTVLPSYLYTTIQNPETLVYHEENQRLTIKPTSASHDHQVPTNTKPMTIIQYTHQFMLPSDDKVVLDADERSIHDAIINEFLD